MEAQARSDSRSGGESTKVLLHCLMQSFPLFFCFAHFPGEIFAMGFGGVLGHWEGGPAPSLLLENDTQLDSYRERAILKEAGEFGPAAGKCCLYIGSTLVYI